MTVSPQYLESQVAALRGRDPEALCFGFHLTGPWEGPAEIQVDGQSYPVRQAATALEVREALLEAEDESQPFVLLTPLTEGRVGGDVLARLARAKLFSVDTWQAVLHLFSARQVDPSLVDRSVAEALVEYAPASGYLPVVSGILDAERVWSELLRVALGVPEGPLDVETLLRWTLEERGRARYRGLGPDLQKAIDRYVAERAFEPGELILELQRDSDESVFALAVVCGVLFGDGEPKEGARRDAWQRLKGKRVAVSAAAGSALAESAERIVRWAADDDSVTPELREALRRADELMRELDLVEEAAASPLTELGYRQRLEEYGTAVAAALKSPEGRGVARDALDRVRDHVAVGRRPHLERAEHAFRLLEWLRTETTDCPSFADRCGEYLTELSWVDRAREALVSGEDLPKLSQAYSDLEDAVYGRRRDWNREFALSAADWLQGGGDGVVPIEQALGRLVAPVAKKRPVLVILLDGMSWPIAHELIEDASRQHLATLAWPDGDGVAPVVATLPTVTEISRASFFAGELMQGTQAQEKPAFAEHAALCSTSKKSHPPLLFHKAELTDGGRGRLQKDVEAAIADENRKVVAVVVNAVDDHLKGAQQTRERWTIDRIRPLGALIRAAFDADRFVVLASDHGHVYHRETRYERVIEQSGASGRWRGPGGKVAEGEIELRGMRVLGASGDSIVVPWDEEIRYTKGTANGYHGGITPQELIAPLVFLTAPGSEVPGLDEIALPAPDWWLAATHRRIEGQGTFGITGKATLTAAKTPTSQKKEPQRTQRAQRAENAELVRSKTAKAAPTGSGPEWLEALFASEVYQAQLELVRKYRPTEDEMRLLLTTLIERGGETTPAALSQRIGKPLSRFDGFLTVVSKILNVDSYEVLAHERERGLVRLSVTLLKQQFEV